MFQGTGSDVGKSTIVAGLCRWFTQQGLRVRPFKPQNMSNNAAVTREGGEIGRAQALQAMACGVAPSVHMNPVLLKPESDTRCQVVVQGHVKGTWQAAGYQEQKASLLPAVLESFAQLQAEADLVLVEGAGSPAETNLRAGDIANMGFALAASVPVCLVADIDRGGVIASVVGTHTVLNDDDRSRIVGFLINKFRGDPRLFDEGLRHITNHTRWPSFGVLPWQSAVARLPSEDAVVLEHPREDLFTARPYVVAVPMLSRIANFDDLDPLRAEPAVRVVMVPPGQPLPQDADLVLVPGTKATIADLDFVRAQGWDIDILAHARQGKAVLGVCGGYQMLGQWVRDPQGLEGPPSVRAGLGLLNVDTTLAPQKILRDTSGHCGWLNAAVRGYEIHAGRTQGSDTDLAMLELAGGVNDGARNARGNVMGTYLHGLFTQDGFRDAFLRHMAGHGSRLQAGFESTVQGALDELAAALGTCIDTDRLWAASGHGG